MHFPNKHFYKGELQCIDGIDRLARPMPNKDDVTESSFSKHRLVYIPCTTADTDMNFKMNTDEARKIPVIVKQLLDRRKDLANQSIGIITPYRAQIANIREHLLTAGIDISEITIDTVERYQGGAKDVILISFCLNHPIQMRNLSVLSSEGVDRKLNVALTRAREQIILLGNRELLELNPLYKDLIDSYKTIEIG